LNRTTKFSLFLSQKNERQQECNKQNIILQNPKERSPMIKTYSIAMLEGDGIEPEVTEATVAVRVDNSSLPPNPFFT